MEIKVSELPPLQEKEEPIHDQIGAGLLGAIPAHWRAATLLVRFGTSPGGTQGLLHTIQSSEGHADLVAPTEDIFSATQALWDLYGTEARRWKALTVSVQFNDVTEKWAMEINYEY
jgi:hypothetical protein